MADRCERFEGIYRNHAPAVLAYALRRSDKETADDVTAETFTVVWRRLDDMPEEPLPWLYGIARRTLANQRRGSRRRTLLHARLSDGERSGPAASDGLVLAALGSLRNADRELLMLVAWEGLTPTQAAAALGCSANACRIRLHRARRRLERALADEGLPRQADAKPREAR